MDEAGLSPWVTVGYRGLPWVTFALGRERLSRYSGVQIVRWFVSVALFCVLVEVSGEACLV